MDLGSRGIVLSYVAEIKALISCAVTAQLIFVFVFALCEKPVFLLRGSYVSLLRINCLGWGRDPNFSVIEYCGFCSERFPLSLGAKDRLRYLSLVVRKPVFGVSDTNRAVQPQKMAKGLKFGLR